MLKSYCELRVWQEGMGLDEEVYRVSRSFPKHEVYGLASQMQRAAVSVPSNIAEGYMREHRPEYLRFLSVAQGSLAELETQLEIARRLGYVEEGVFAEMEEQVTRLAKQLRVLRKKLVE